METEKTNQEAEIKVIGETEYVRREFPLIGPGDKTDLPEEPKLETPKKSFEETCREIVDKTLNKSFELNFEPADNENLWARITIPSKYVAMFLPREQEVIKLNGGQDVRARLINPYVMPELSFEEFVKSVWNALSSDHLVKQKVWREIEKDRITKK